MRDQTIGAVFDPFIVGKITAAVFAQSVERAVTEKAVEVFFRHTAFQLVTREVFALSVTEKLEILCFRRFMPAGFTTHKILSRFSAFS